MRRADRLFDIIQMLRAAKRPVTADMLAERLEVTVRTIYRDMATLQARQVPIEGEAGVGYIMRPGYDLPPLMFTLDEIEAISVGLAMLERTADCGLRGAGADAADKIRFVLPYGLCHSLEGSTTKVSNWPVPEVRTSTIAAARDAIRRERKLCITYRDEQSRETQRTIQPLALVYYAEVIVIVAWCELRDDIRHFRADRVERCEETEETFTGESDTLRMVWQRAET